MLSKCNLQDQTIQKGGGVLTHASWIWFLCLQMAASTEQGHISRREQESPSAASVCHKASDSCECFVLPGPLLGLCNHVLPGLGSRVPQSAQICTWLSQKKADLSTSRMFTSHKVQDSISVPESPSVPKALGMMPRTTDWPGCPCVLYSDCRALSKVLKLFTFPEMGMKTGHAHLYRLSTDAFLMSFLQQTLPAPPSLCCSLQEGDVPTFCVICPLSRRGTSNFIPMEPPDIGSDGTDLLMSFLTPL